MMLVIVTIVLMCCFIVSVAVWFNGAIVVTVVNATDSVLHDVRIQWLDRSRKFERIPFQGSASVAVYSGGLEERPASLTWKKDGKQEEYELNMCLPFNWEQYYVVITNERVFHTDSSNIFLPPFLSLFRPLASM